MKTGLVFTPRGHNGERLSWRISGEDMKNVGRGRKWKATVTNLLDGKTYEVKGASCGSSSCFCDAVVVREVDTP